MVLWYCFVVESLVPVHGDGHYQAADLWGGRTLCNVPGDYVKSAQRERERERDAECLDARSQDIPCYRSPLIWQISAAAASSPIYYRTTWAAGSFRRVWQLSCAADSTPAAGAIRRSPDVAWDWEWRHRTVGELRTHRSAFVILVIEWLKFCVQAY